jgi:hypothetical protein
MNFESLEDFLTRSASTTNTAKPENNTVIEKDLNSSAGKNDYSAFNDHVAFLNSNLGIGDAYKGLGNSEPTNSGTNIKIQPVPTTPAVAAVSSVTLAASKTVKTAPIDTILFDDNSVSVDKMFNLILEDIGGQELINIARNDIINGQQVSYQPIKNLSSIQQQYNPNNILGIQNTSDKYFSNFSIKLENKIPNNGNGPSGSNVYLENLTGNLVIETVNMESDEQIEVEVTVSATIYEAEFGDIES